MSEVADAPGKDSSRGRLIAVSNRLPIVLHRRSGGWEVEPGSGGLVTALAPVLRDRGGTWVGWPGTVEAPDAELRELLGELSRDAGYDFTPVSLTARERDEYYFGFANEVLWPLLHDLQSRYRFDPAYWETYRRVNRRFARVVARAAEPDDYVWIHDYHLMGVAEGLREEGWESGIGYFLHTPFPAPDVYVKLPWRGDVLRLLLQYDLLGFQTLRDRRNFLECVGVLLPGAEVEGRGAIARIRWEGRTVRVGAFPISIDFEEFEEMARSAEVRHERDRIAENLRDRMLALGVDRLDYTKGIPNQLKAFRTALERHPELQGGVSLVQVVVPSREGIPEYDDLRTEIDRLVGEINGEFSEAGWVPVHYLYRTLERPELVAYYRHAALALVTPLKDGMNLVAKEYCAASVEEDGVLVLSEFAGAAAQLQDGALMVNPYDIVGVADAIQRAVTMTREERRSRMRALRETVREHDVYRWVELFLDAAAAEDVEDHSAPWDYAPRERLQGR